MKVVINYCDMCGGRGEADAAAKEIKQYFGLDAEIVDVSKGRFEVVVEGRTVFSKAQTGRFPKKGEIAKLMRAGK